MAVNSSRKVHILAGVAQMLLLVLGLVAQSLHPDVSGAWLLDPTRSTETGNGPGRGSGGGDGDGGGLSLGPLPDALTIRQTPDMLPVEERLGSGIAFVSYGLNGSATTNLIPRGRNAGRTSTAVTYWKGDRLVTLVFVPVLLAPAGQASYEEVRYLDADGSLVVLTTLPQRDRPRIAVYVRAP
jgi:hypothetical protein